jgi:hypothetical protein
MPVVPDAITSDCAAADAAFLMGGIGPVTSAGEILATSIGAGILLGGFAGGVLGTALRWDAIRRDTCAMHMGYFGGLTMAIAVVIEAIVR